MRAVRNAWLLVSVVAACGGESGGSTPSVDAGVQDTKDAAQASDSQVTSGEAAVADAALEPGADASDNRDASSSMAPKLPPVNASFDYQLGGSYAPPSGVMVVARDRKAQPAEGLYNICYVNGFQTQPEEASFWEQQHPDLLLRKSSGALVIDPDWPDERLLDIRTEPKREQLRAIIGGYIAQCARDGFDAVEIDNLNTYTRSQLPQAERITEQHAVAYMRSLADVAHQHGLAIAQKNSAELAPRKAELGTDFAVAEECNQWQECDAYTEHYGEHVLIIEYQRSAFQAGCSAYPGLSIVLRDVPLRRSGESGYVYEGC